ncbi:MAG TPA: sodium:solute symporter family protein [Bacillota bacterium]
MTAASQVGMAVLVLYLVAVLYIGWRAYRVGSENFADQAVANRGLGIFVLTLTYAATYHSAYAFTGIVGFAQGDGIPFWINGLWLVPPTVLFWEFGKRLWVLGKRYNYVSLAQYLGDAYDNRTVAMLTALVQTVFIVPYVTVQLIGTGYIFNTVTGGAIPFEVGAAIMLVVMIIYVWAGGMRAVAWTDTVQGIMMFLAVVGGSFFVTTQLGGSITGVFQQAAAQVPEAFSLPGRAGAFTPVRWISQWVPLCLGVILAPQLVLRMFSARSLNVLKWASVGGAVYITAIYTFTPAVGMAGILYGGDYAPDQFFVAMLWEHLPVLLAGLALAGGFAAAMSTADSQIHAVSTTVAGDIYAPLVRRKPSDRELTRVMHIVHVLLGAAAYYWVLTQPPALINIVTIAVGGTAMLAPALVGALYSRRVSGPVAALSIVVGLAALVVTQFLWRNPLGLGILPGMWGLILSTLVVVLGALIVKAQPSERLIEQHGHLRSIFGA